MTISGKARVAGVIGWPVSHSLSPVLHNGWLARYGIDGAYVPLAVPPERAMEAIRALPALGFRGANVTIPHKLIAYQMADALTDTARRVGAVNTLVVGEKGRIVGENTDVFGFIENLRAGAPAWRPDNAPGLVLGAGGAARAVVVGLLDAGVPEVRVANRTTARADELAADMGAGVRVVSWPPSRQDLADVGVIVNTTSMGMAGHGAGDALPDLSALPSTAVANDIVYTPLDTPFLRAAAAKGCQTVDGLGMLIHQARPGFAAWYGEEPLVLPEDRSRLLARLGG